MSEAILSIKLYREGMPSLALNLEPIHVAERRLSDLALATKHQAPGLFVVYMQGYISAAKQHAAILVHMQKAAIAARRRRSVLLLDEIPAKAAAKGLGNSRNPTGSEDVREAFFYADPEYIAIEESRASLEAAEKLFFGKMMAMKMACEAAKMMMAPGDRPHIPNDHIPGVQGIDERPRMVQEEHEEAQGFSDPDHR